VRDFCKQRFQVFGRIIVDDDFAAFTGPRDFHFGAERANQFIFQFFGFRINFDVPFVGFDGNFFGFVFCLAHGQTAFQNKFKQGALFFRISNRQNGFGVLRWQA